MLHASPVSPSFPELSGGGGASASSGHAAEQLGEDVDEEVDLKLAMPNDPIVGVELILRDEHGARAREAQPSPSPSTMTPTQKAKASMGLRS